MTYYANSDFQHDGEVVYHTGDKVTKSRIEAMGLDFDAEVESGAILSKEMAEALEEGTVTSVTDAEHGVETAPSDVEGADPAPHVGPEKAPDKPKQTSKEQQAKG